MLGEAALARPEGWEAEILRLKKALSLGLGGRTPSGWGAAALAGKKRL